MSDAAHVEEHSDHTGAKIGMWLFLFTEMLLFGGLFLLYAVYRAGHAEDFHYAAGTLDSLMGTINTLVLLTSSLTMALAIAMLARGRRLLALVLLLATIAAGLAFMVNKYLEWTAKFEHHLFPNSDELLRHTPGENVFYGLYYLMTGLHGVHVVIGITVLLVMVILVLRRGSSEGAVDPRLVIKVENTGLYWHLVDVVWIFLFPLFYLVS